MTDIFDDIDADEARRKAARSAQEARQLRAQLDTERKRGDELQAALNAIRRMEEHAPPPPKRRAVVEGKKPPKTATAVLACSDWHVEKIIHSRQVGGRNHHSPDVSRARVMRLVEAWTWYLRDAFGAGQVIDEAVIWLGGDMIENSGMPHADSAEGCAMPPGEAILHAMESWERIIARTLDLGLPVRVICNDGNHGRFGEHRRHQNRTGHSIETLAYRMSAGRMTGANWHIADGQVTHHDVQSHVLRTQHGDSGGLRYQGGVGGLTVPYLRARPRWDAAESADYDLIGHWHQAQVLAGRCVVNGSLCGWDTYAQAIGAPYEPPAQMAFLIDSEHGLRFAVPLYVGEP